MTLALQRMEMWCYNDLNYINLYRKATDSGLEVPRYLVALSIASRFSGRYKAILASYRILSFYQKNELGYPVPCSFVCLSVHRHYLLTSHHITSLHYKTGGMVMYLYSSLCKVKRNAFIKRLCLLNWNILKGYGIATFEHDKSCNRG